MMMIVLFVLDVLSDLTLAAIASVTSVCTFVLVFQILAHSLKRTSCSCGACTLQSAHTAKNGCHAGMLLLIFVSSVTAGLNLVSLSQRLLGQGPQYLELLASMVSMVTAAPNL